VCGWSNSVRAVLQKYDLPYEDRDIINDRSNYSEMVRKSGQPLSPCVEIDGEMLADVAGTEVEEYLASKGFDPDYGARPLRRLIQNEVEDALSDGILSNRFKLASEVRVTVGDDGELLLEAVEDRSRMRLELAALAQKSEGEQLLSLDLESFDLQWHGQ